MDYQVAFQNPHATKPMTVNVTSNVSIAEINENVRVNSQRDVRWIAPLPERETEIIIVGGGPSVADELGRIRNLMPGRAVMALNGASRYLTEAGIQVDIQFIMDARLENEAFIDPDAKHYIFASQCHPALFERVGNNVELVHLASPSIEDNLPRERVAAGGYTLLGGAASIGNSAAPLAYVLGFRKMHLFGYDSSMRNGAQHAYEQPLNNGETAVPIRFRDQMYWCTYTMAVQYEHFFKIAAELERLGCQLEIYGDGILPAKWHVSRRLESEKEKYHFIWSDAAYGRYSPAESLVEQITNTFAPGPLIDLGCGTGRAAVALTELGYDVTLMDFVDNSRDEKALSLSFIEHDLSEPLPGSWPAGYCCDVMEHIPPEQVDAVLKNLRDSVSDVFFRIEFEPDAFGPALIGKPLHLSLHPASWWKAKLHEYWPVVHEWPGGIFIARSTEEW